MLNFKANILRMLITIALITKTGRSTMEKDNLILQELAKEVLEISNKPIQNERRELWRKQNSFQNNTPLIYMRAFAFDEFFDRKLLKCEDAFLRSYEYYLNLMKFRDTIGDDFIIEPWLTLNATYIPSVENRWGVRVSLSEKMHSGDAAKFIPELIEEEDINRLVSPNHIIDEYTTNLQYKKLQDAIGGLMEIHVSRSSIYSMWNTDISTDLAKLIGLEQYMWYIFDRPQWLHKILAFMRDAIIKVHNQVEASDDFSLADQINQAMPYSKELKDPNPSIKGVKRSEMWWFMASQESTGLSPDMFYEFMLQYQIPIVEKFGLSAYGCCEDLTQKIDYLRKIPNLRRIAVSPYANAEKSAEQIGEDYILSWRPNPSSMISTGLDEEFVRKHMRDNFKIFKKNKNHFDITLKDVETINNQPENIAKWVKIVRQEIENAF